MSENTKIQWTDHTFNPWMGCTKVSPGCANCYAEVSTPSRARGVKWGKGQPRQRTSASNWKEPLRWNKQAAGKATRPRVFCASLADWLDDEVPIEWLADLLKLIHETPNLDWQLLTKRPENFERRLEQVEALDLGDDEVASGMCSYWLSELPPANVWIGTTVEDQQRADERIPHLLNIPAKVRFLSVEPMLGLIDFTSHLLRARGGLHWAIFGGESGKNARPCDVSWIRVAGTQCRLYHIAPFVKQLGSAAGVKHPKGGDPDEWPEDLRVREFPNV